MKKSLPIILLLSCAYCMPAHAVTQIYKCVSTNGPIIFSDTTCPASTQQSTHKVLRPMLIPAPSKKVIEQATRKHPRQQNKTRVTVIGDQSHLCGDHDRQEQRTAMVRKQVKTGMSLSDIESMYGKPIKSSISNGVLTATYRSAKGQTRSVRFDEHGCVRLNKKSAISGSSTKKQSNKKK